MSVLLGEAIERYATVCKKAGRSGPVKIDRETPEQAKGFEELIDALSPAVLPSELVAFWSEWDPRSFTGLAESDIGLLSPSRANEEWKHTVRNRFPPILLPFAAEEKRLLALELVTESHPGSRLFELDFHGNLLPLLGVGVSDFINMVADTIEQSYRRGPYTDNGDPVAMVVYEEVLHTAQAAFGDVVLDNHDRSTWPDYWLLPIGFNTEQLRLRGRTHTVVDFDHAREQQSPLHGVLQGRIMGRETVRALGGTLDSPICGAIKELHDQTGHIQLLILETCSDAGLGPDGRCEIEVVAMPKSGLGLGSMPSSLADIAGLLSNQEARVEWQKGLLETVYNLDISAVVTAIRPMP